MTGRCLVVANQTLGGDALDEAVEDCMNRGLRDFYVVVPRTHVEHEAAGWTGGFGVGDGASPDATRPAVEDDARRQEEALDEAQTRAQDRLFLMVKKIHSLGGSAEGEVGSEDPLEAIETVLEREPEVEEIIVSTLPAGLSRWLRMDLRNRVARMTDLPVTTIEAIA